MNWRPLSTTEGVARASRHLGRILRTDKIALTSSNRRTSSACGTAMRASRVPSRERVPCSRVHQRERCSAAPACATEPAGTSHDAVLPVHGAMAGGRHCIGACGAEPVTPAGSAVRPAGAGGRHAPGNKLDAQGRCPVERVFDGPGRQRAAVVCRDRWPVQLRRRTLSAPARGLRPSAARAGDHRRDGGRRDDLGRLPVRRHQPLRARRGAPFRR